MKLLQDPLSFWMAHPVTKSRIRSRTVSEEVVDLLARMLVVNPEERITKNGIQKHTWMLKYSKDIYEENDYEDFEFSPEVLNEDDDSDYIINDEELKSSDSDTESQGNYSEKSQKLELDSNNDNKSIRDIEIDSSYSGIQAKEDLLQKCIIPKQSFLKKIETVLKSIKPIPN